ncbi:MAG: cytochrome c biogenesis protein ResB [Prevotellaceae bacterium]|jgi:hypothetical protein|nr:cytochrome c biogenesis protein ResB [Prevotellaceae bacterium]
MWKHPWGYLEGLTICAGLIVTGGLLQSIAGEFDSSALSYPVNVIALAAIVLLPAALHVLSRKHAALRWFSSYRASITALAAFLFLMLVAGLVPQTTGRDNAETSSGFDRVVSSWPFALTFVYLLAVLGAVVLRRLQNFDLKKDTGFVLNHVGLFVALVCAALGAGDLQRLRMTVALNTPEWRAANEKNEIEELAMALELNSFVIDEYPPRLMMLDNTTGEVLPKGRPEDIRVETCPLAASLRGWEIEVVKFLPSAASMTTKDTVFFTEFHSEGATSALYVRARNPQTGVSREGWVSCGNYMFPYHSLRLSADESLIMPRREPRRFASAVTAYSKDEAAKNATIEVNKPMRYGGWKIYQSGYDEERGKWSRTSMFELVRDPWLPAVYAGIWMMIGGAVCLFVSAPKKNTITRDKQ